MSVPGTRRDGGTDSFSASAWVDAALRGALDRAVPAILEGAQPFRPRCLLLSGSACLGEAVGWEADDPAERLVLSDLDLGLVTADRVPEAARASIQRAARSAGHLEMPAAEGNRRALSRVTIPASPPVTVTLGFYESAWWSRQEPTLGMADARTHGIVVWGDAAFPSRLVVPAMARIPSWEGVRLVGNRALELLTAPGRSSAAALRPFGWYALAKAATGLATAGLVSRGRYRTGREVRRTLLEESLGDGGAAPSATLTRVALDWAPFLERPGTATLPARPTGLADFRRALSVWLDTLPPDLRPPGAAVETVFLREPGSMRGRLRAWRAEGRRAPGAAGTSGAPGEERRAGWHRWLAGTPGGRRMAAAVLYWRDLPERPEPCWGEIPDDPLDSSGWEASVGRLLGRRVPVGRGCRARLAGLLGLDKASAWAPGEGETGD